ncbi:MAG: MBL fold metallo-hydrolase [Deltaproteobacteria bacterium]|nr:MBL fold metallo-hydrolase [Deltaproteobacteria bacterium]
MPSGFDTLSFFQWLLRPRQRHYTKEEKSHLPAVIPDPLQRIAALGNKDFILWIGHNSFLIRIKGVFWITDPVFSARVLMVKRKIPPALTAAEINGLTHDLRVIITHNHYDHLDLPSLKQLSSASQIFLPLGLGAMVAKLGNAEIFEMDWWQERNLGEGVELVCLPAQHSSGRLGQKKDSTLWASFLLKTPKTTFFFGGDSGYFRGFGEIGKYYPKIDFAFLPIAACHPRWFMHYNNLDVEESLRAFEDLKAHFFIPTQWGTFNLSEEPPGYPALALQRKIAESRRDPTPFRVMDVGELLILDEKAPGMRIKR